MSAPHLRLEPGEATRVGDVWRTTWRVRNEGAEAVTLEAATVPHALYRAPELRLDRQVASGGHASFGTDVRVQGEAGGTVENAFVILLVRRGEERWRLLFRVRVPIGPDGTPRAAVEAVTSHRAGFTD